LVALAALRLFVFLNLGTLVARLAVTVLLTPMVLAAGAVGLAHAVHLQVTGASRLQEQSDCFRTDHYAALARLPAGLVATDVDFGPFLLALTPHSVLAAPYHRLSTGIIAADRVFTAPPDEARRILTGLRATYLVTCGSRPPAALTEADRDASLWGRLQTGTIPDWLEPVPDTEGQAFRVYRIRSEART
jgi:hypothetical protein